jgi:hypothetical protein
MAITETVLEMHYHKPMLDLIRSTYGVGPTGHFNFYKYSPQKEVFLGFDQAYAMTQYTDEQFFDLLKNSAMNAGYKLPSKFLAYFLQYKVVSELSKRQKKTPTSIKNKPHYRATLDTTKNDRTGFSQHELLHNLSSNDGAMVYYACPMILEKADLYEPDPTLDTLQLVDMASCPGSFSDNSKHYIYFDQKTAQPVWCSDPVQGKSVTAKQFVRQVLNQIERTEVGQGGEGVLSMLTAMKERKADAESKEKGESSVLGLVSDSLAIVQFIPGAQSGA